MKERYEIRCAVFLILTKRKENQEFVLLQKRFQTGILDGMYDVSASGHLEKDETLKQAMVREAKEELGIDIEEENLEYVSMMHAKFKDHTEYLLVTFHTSQYEKIPMIMEPNKCNDLTWYPIDQLPENLIDTRKTMIQNYLEKNFYSEYGWYEYDKNRNIRK